MSGLRSSMTSFVIELFFALLLSHQHSCIHDENKCSFINKQF